MEMSRFELAVFYSQLKNTSHLRGVRLAHARSKALQLLKPEMEAMDKAKEMTPNYQEFEKKRIELCEKFSKDEKGNIIKTGPNYNIQNKTAFDKAFSKLKDDNRKTVKDRDKQVKEFNKFEKEIIDTDVFNFSLIFESDLPEDISGSDYEAFFPLITDESEIIDELDSSTEEEDDEEIIYKSKQKNEKITHIDKKSSRIRQYRKNR